MGLTFISGIVIYILLLVMLMIWFIKYHHLNNRIGTEHLPEKSNMLRDDIKEDQTKQPDLVSAAFPQSGVQSGTKKSEVLPKYNSFKQ